MELRRATALQLRRGGMEWDGGGGGTTNTPDRNFTTCVSTEGYGGLPGAPGSPGARIKQFGNTHRGAIDGSSLSLHRFAAAGASGHCSIKPSRFIYVFVVLVCLGYREPPEGLRKPRESPRRALGDLSGAPGPPGARIKIHGNLYFLQGSKERMGGAGSSPTEGALSSASAQAGTDSPPQVLRTIAQSSLLGFCICCFGLSWAPGSSGRPSEAPGMPPPPPGGPCGFSIRHMTAPLPMSTVSFLRGSLGALCFGEGVSCL